MIEALLSHKSVVRALLDNITVLDYEDHVGILYGRQTVGDNEAGPALHKRMHCRLYFLLGT